MYRGYCDLPCHDFEAWIQEEETIVKLTKSITGSNIFDGK